jgi:hypothetical protein
MVQSAAVITSPHFPPEQHFAALLAAPSVRHGVTMPNLAAAREPPFALTPTACARVELALEGAFHRHEVALKELRSAIAACVLELQGQGMLPEAMLVTMRAFMQHTVANPSVERPVAARAAHLLMDEIIHWSILAYYPGAIVRTKRRASRRGEES